VNGSTREGDRPILRTTEILLKEDSTPWFNDFVERLVLDAAFLPGNALDSDLCGSRKLPVCCGGRFS
jgi:hypothetical protein